MVDMPYTLADAALLKPEAPPHEEPDREWDVRVLQMLHTHGERESEALDSYRRLVNDSIDEGVRYLGRMILEDEERHHRTITEMTNSVRSFIEELDLEPQVPAVPRRVDPVLLDETRRLLALEKEDAKELRDLRRELRGAPSSSLHPLLVELMLLDTRKHIAILRLILARASRH